MSSASSRTNAFAFVAYPESLPADWLCRLEGLHVPCYVSPLHIVDEGDAEDVPDGGPFKPHYHCVLQFDRGVKSLEQVCEMLDEVGLDFEHGVSRKKLRLKNTPGMLRYICHLDQPTKTQYSPKDVVCLSGADYMQFLSENMRSDNLKELFKYIVIHNHVNFAMLCLDVMESRPDLWSAIKNNNTNLILNFIKSYSFGCGSGDFDQSLRADYAAEEAAYLEELANVTDVEE